jgi:hypothetical protein
MIMSAGRAPADRLGLDPASPARTGQAATMTAAAAGPSTQHDNGPSHHPARDLKRNTAQVVMG